MDSTMGSLSNTLGTMGGFCVADKCTCDYQRLIGPGYTFTTAPPPHLMAAACRACVSRQCCCGGALWVQRELRTAGLLVPATVHSVASVLRERVLRLLPTLFLH